MNLLAFDTSTSCASLALSIKGKIIESEELSVVKHAQVILTRIEHVLKKASISIDQLDGIVFGRGPGSFTGLRIACSIAKGLAYPHHLPLYPVSSLATIAYEMRLQRPEQSAAILSLIDARMNELYWSYYAKKFLDVEEHVSSAKDIKIPDGPLCVVGINFQPYSDFLPEAVRSNIIEEQEIKLKAKTMIQLVKDYSIKPIQASEAHPIYIRNQVTGR